MAEALLRIEAAGPLTSLQDAGRPGWRRFGVPPSGPVDRRAYAAAVAATGGHATAIECSLGGMTLIAEGQPLLIAITGAITAAVDGVEIGGWCAVTLPPGVPCRIREAGGNWGYVAVAGLIEAPAWLGSTATHFLAGLGGGRIAAGTSLVVQDARGDLASFTIPRPPEAQPIHVARAILGPQHRFFAPDMLDRLDTASFAASARFDRMGLVLDGPALPPLRVDMPSEPAVRGALQIDGDGRMSLLTADHQTTGGYPRIAVVIDPDIDRVAQLPAGAPIQLALITAEESVSLTRADHDATAHWLTQVQSRVRPRPSLLAANLVDGVVVAR